METNNIKKSISNARNALEELTNQTHNSNAIKTICYITKNLTCCISYLSISNIKEIRKDKKKESFETIHYLIKESIQAMIGLLDNEFKNDIGLEYSIYNMKRNLQDIEILKSKW